MLRFAFQIPVVSCFWRPPYILSRGHLQKEPTSYYTKICETNLSANFLWICSKGSVWISQGFPHHTSMRCKGWLWVILGNWLIKCREDILTLDESLQLRCMRDVLITLLHGLQFDPLSTAKSERLVVGTRQPPYTVFLNSGSTELCKKIFEIPAAGLLFLQPQGD